MDTSKEGKDTIIDYLDKIQKPEEALNKCIEQFIASGVTSNYSKVLSYVNNNKLEISANSIIKLAEVLEKNNINIESKGAIKLIEQARKHPSSNVFWLWGTGNPVEFYIFDKPALINDIKTMIISKRKFGFIGSESSSDRDFDYDIVYYKNDEEGKVLAPSYVVKYILAYLDTPYEDEKEYKEKAIKALDALDDDSFKKMIEKSFKSKFLKKIDSYVQYDILPCHQYQLNLYGRFGSGEMIKSMYDRTRSFGERSKKAIILALSFSNTSEANAILIDEGATDKKGIQYEYNNGENQKFVDLQKGK